MKRTIVCGMLLPLLFGSVLYGQAQEYDTRTFQIRNRSAQEMYEMIEPFLSDARGNDRASVSHTLQSITVYAHQEKLDKIEKAISSFDVPLKQVWVEVLLVEATGNGGGKPEVPPELKDLARQLESVFAFRKYAVVGRVHAMGLEGAMIRTSSLSADDNSSHPDFRIQGGLKVMGNRIQLNPFSVVVDKPIRSEISSTINIPDGNKMILGATESGSDEASLITVVTARIIQ